MRSPLRLVPAAALAVALALTGCTSSGGADPDSEQSPLAEYFDAIYGGDLSDEEQEARIREDETAREKLVSECMTEQGFEYIPAVQSGSYVSSGGEYEPEDRDWVTEYGYGMINYPGKDDPAPVEEFVDPNQDYVASLSESEQQAFYEALSGPPMTEEQMGDDGSYEYDWETAGCYGYAQNELQGEDPTQSEEFKPLLDKMNEVYTQVEEAPELAELNAAWATCMDEAGYPGFSVQYDASSSISEEYNALWENVTDEDGPDESLTDALAEKEVELALADLDCREATDYRDGYAALQSEIEQRFIDDNKAELDALKAAVEQGR